MSMKRKVMIDFETICAQNAVADKISYDNDMKQRLAFLRNRVLVAQPKGLDLERAQAMIRWAQLVNWDNVCGDTRDCGGCGGCGGYDKTKELKQVPHQDSAIEGCALCDRSICVWCLPRCFFSFDRYNGEWVERYNKDGEVKNPDLSRNELLINETVFYYENVPRSLICPGCVDAWRARKGKQQAKPVKQPVKVKKPAKPIKKPVKQQLAKRKPVKKPAKKVEKKYEEEETSSDSDSEESEASESIDFQEQFRAAQELQTAAKQLQAHADRMLETLTKRRKTN